MCPKAHRQLACTSVPPLRCRDVRRPSSWKEPQVTRTKVRASASAAQCTTACATFPLLAWPVSLDVLFWPPPIAWLEPLGLCGHDCVAETRSAQISSAWSPLSLPGLLLSSPLCDSHPYRAARALLVLHLCPGAGHLQTFSATAEQCCIGQAGDRGPAELIAWPLHRVASLLLAHDAAQMQVIPATLLAGQVHITEDLGKHVAVMLTL